MGNRYSEFALLHLLLATILGIFSATSGQNTCSIPYAQPDRYLPLINSHVRGILYPVSDWSIEVHLGETVDIVCTGNNNTLSGTELTHLTTTCQPPGSLTTAIDFTYNCSKEMVHTVLGPVKGCGLRGSTKIFQIGWSLPNGEFSSQVEVCYNTRSFSPEYSKHILIGSMFHGKNMSWLTQPNMQNKLHYNIYENQTQYLTNLLKNSTLAIAYSRGQGNHLEGVPLSSAGDFNTQTWKDAASDYSYRVPMWKALSNGIWKIVGAQIRRKTSEEIPRNFTIYTGTHGILKLVDGENNLVHIYLDRGRNGPQYVVPEHIWKIVYDEKINEAVAFVLLNHPNNPQYPIPEPPPLCPDICDRIRLNLSGNRNKINKGKIYCCTVESLRSKIPNIPVPQNVNLMFGKESNGG